MRTYALFSRSMVRVSVRGIAAILLSFALATALDAAPQTDSNAFNDRTQLDLHVSPRTGMVSVSMPVLALPGKGSLGLDLSYTFHQGGGSNRYEPIAPGWGVDLPFYDVDQERLTLGNGQSYLRQGGILRYYRLEDVDFRAENGTGPDGQDYAFVLTHLWGRRDTFDRNGNITASVDRFGNFISYRVATYDPEQGAAFFASITDTFGQVLRFEHDAQGRRILTLPNGHQVTLQHIPEVDRLVLTNPLNEEFWVDGGEQGTIASVHYPTGLDIKIGYQDLVHASGPPLRVVRSVQKLDSATGLRLEAEALYDFDPEGNEGHNFLGPCTDQDRDCLMEDEENRNYFYQSRVDRGEVSTLNRFDHFHRQRERRVFGVASDGAATLLRTTTYDYPGNVDIPFGQLPPNYQRPNSVTTQFFDPDGSSRSVRHELVHDDYGRKISETRADGTVTTWSYDDPTGPLGEGAYGLPLSQTVTTPEGKVIRHVSTPSEDHRTIVQTVLSGTTATGASDPFATVTTFTNYADGRLESRNLRWVDPPPGQPFASTGSELLYDTLVWNGIPARSITRIDPVGNAWQTVIEASNGRRIARIDPLGHTETHTWDALGRLKQITRADGTSTAFEYSLGPNQETIRHSNGQVELWTYDALGRPVELADNNDHARGVLLPEPSLLRKRVTYDDLGRKAGVSTFEPGSDVVADFVALCYDPLDRPTVTAEGVPCDQADNGQSFASILSYDDTANTVTARRFVPSDLVVEGDAGFTTITTQDALARVRQVDLEPETSPLGPLPGGRARTFDYDGFGRLHTSENAVLRHTTDHTPQGWPVLQTLEDPASGATLSHEHRYDLLGNRLQTLVSQTVGGRSDAYDGAVHFYDPAGRLTAIKSPSGRTVERTYRADGRLASQTNRDGNVLYFDYDDAGRRTDQCFGPPGRTGSGVCDRPGATAHLRWTYIDDDPNLQGLLRSVEMLEPGLETGMVPGAVRYDYYPNGRQRSITYPDPAGGPPRTMTFTYDAWANSHTDTDFFGVTTTYTYTDQGGRRLLAGASSSNGSAVTYGYYPSHLLRTITRSLDDQEVSTTTFEYTALGEVASLQTLDFTNLLLLSERYAYGPDGRVFEVETASDAFPTAIDPLGIRRYAYQLDRLAREEDARGAQTPRVTDFAFDAAGNLTTRGDQSQDFDADNQLTAIHDPSGGRPTAAFAWNANGNLLVDDQGNQYGFNRLNKLVGFTGAEAGSPPITYSYYADGRRASRGIGAVNQRFFYNARGDVANSTVDGTRFSDYLVGHRREGRTLDGATAFYHHDRHGSVSALLPTDGAPDLYAYDAWGTQTAGLSATVEEDPLADNPYRYTGAYFDAATGLYHLKARDYSPRLASFISRDSADLLNRTAYAGGNPVMKVDPSGHVAWYDIVAPIVGAVVTLATGGLGAPLVDGSLLLGAALAAGSGVAGSAASDGIIAAGHGKVDWGASLAAGAVGGFLGAGTGGAVGQSLERLGTAFSVRALSSGIAGGVAGALGSVGTRAVITGTPFLSGSNLVSLGVGLVAGGGGGVLEGIWVPEASNDANLQVQSQILEHNGARRGFVDFSPSDRSLDAYVLHNQPTDEADQQFNVVIIHGGPREFYAEVDTPRGVRLRRISPRRLANEVRTQFAQADRRPIRLASCFTGRLSSGPYSVFHRLSAAQRLANELGTEVRAATMSLLVGGIRTENPAREFTGLDGWGGRWITINPQVPRGTLHQASLGSQAETVRRARRGSAWGAPATAGLGALPSTAP